MSTTITVNEELPQIDFKIMGNDGPETITTSDIFSGKKVALFAVPGAFTPTCSAKHLPGFIDKKAAIKAKGVDTIACLSVNDVFVMDAWAKSYNINNNDILMLADGSADFTQAIGLELDATAFGMGLRSQRYAMIVDNGVVTQLYVEKPKEFEVSSAEFILKVLNEA